MWSIFMSLFPTLFEHREQVYVFLAVLAFFLEVNLGAQRDEALRKAEVMKLFLRAAVHCPLQ